MDIRPFLEDLESRLSPDVEEPLLRSWLDFADDRFHGDVFVPARMKAAPPKVAWPEKIFINDAIEDFDIMALAQYSGCSKALAKGTGDVIMVRCNYGTSILPSLFGVEMFMMDRELNTLPTSRPLNDSAAIRRLVERGVPDLRLGLAPKVFEMAERFMQIGRTYPKIGKYIPIFHPDLQGAMDNCEIIWGSSIFMDLVDDPKLVKDFLQVVIDTYIAFMRQWNKLVPMPADGHGRHWQMLHKGSIMLRCDSAMNLSPEMFDEFIRPSEQRLLDELGGGAMHFCGRGDHFIESLASMRGISCIAMSQPHLNDMEVIYRHTVDKGIKLINFVPDAAAAALARGRNLRGQVHCWTLQARRVEPG